MGNQQLTDLSYLREVAMGDDEIVVETTEAFIDDTPAALQNLQDHFANQRWNELSKQAHKMKPSLKYMGIESALELILDIEKQAKTENISSDLGEKIQKISAICRESLKELSVKIEDLKSSNN